VSGVGLVSGTLSVAPLLIIPTAIINLYHDLSRPIFLEHIQWRYIVIYRMLDVIIGTSPGAPHMGLLLRNVSSVHIIWFLNFIIGMIICYMFYKDMMCDVEFRSDSDVYFCQPSASVFNVPSNTVVFAIACCCLYGAPRRR